MNTKDVTIRILGGPEYAGQDEDSIEFLTGGQLTVKDKPGHFELSYQESELTGMEGTTTTFKITPRRILLMRSGPVSNQMLFEEGRRHNAVYATPFGQMQVGVCASYVHSTINEHGGDLEIDYAIDIDNAMNGEASLRIQVKETAVRPSTPVTVASTPWTC